MRFRFHLVFAIQLVTTSLLQAQNSSDDLPLFTINGAVEPVNEFIYLYKKNHEGRKEEFTKDKIEEYLQLYINFKLKVKEAESRGLDRSAEFVKELDGYKNELRRPFVAEPDLVDQLAREAYERLKQEIKASHILVALPPGPSPADTMKSYKRAVEIRSRIKSGEDFEKMAREESDDPSAKSNGGSLGYFTALQMVFPFEQAAYQMKPGDISMPVRTRFGYHIIRVEDKIMSKGEVEVSHILVRGNESKAKDAINEAYLKLTEGANWDTICKDYSEDPGTKESGGRLKPFGRGALASAPQFEEVSFSLQTPGTFSAPFQTGYGWHIVRLERKIPLPPYEELGPSLKRRVARDERMEVTKDKQRTVRKEKLGYRPSNNLSELLKMFSDSSLVIGEFKLDLIKDSMEQVLFFVGVHSYQAKDFGHFVEANQKRVGGNIDEHVFQLFNQYVDEALQREEDYQLMQSNPEYRNLVNEYREGILLFNIMEMEVWNKASEDSVGQRRYFESHPEKYSAGERIQCQIFSTSVRQKRDSVILVFQPGDSVDLNQNNFKIESTLRNFEKGDHKVVDQIEWTSGIYSIDADGKYYLVEAKKMIPPGIKSFDEARASIISDYQDFLEQEWIKQLKSKYSVKINSKGKKQALLELLPTK